jgi:hypothetical protein
VVPFAPLPDDLVAQILTEHGVTDPALLTRVTRLAEGSPGQGLAFADPDLWAFRRTLLEGLCHPEPDTVELARTWVRFVEEAGKEAAVQRRRAALVIRLLVAALADVLRIRERGSPRTADPEDLGYLRGLGERVPAEGLLGLIDRCLEADEHLGRYIQVALVLEGLMDALGQRIRERAA